MASFISVQGCRLPRLKPSKLSNSPKSLPNCAGKRYPNKVNTRHARRQKPPQGHSNGSRAPPGRSNGFLYAFKGAVCQASNAPNPPKVRPAPQGKGTPTSPTRATPARKSHHKATAMAQEHPTAAAMASFIGVQGCRLPGLKPSKPSNSPKVAQLPQGKGTPTSPTRATPARKSHHKATAMAQEHPTAAAMASFIGVQGCRLPGLKPSKPSNSSKSLPNSAGKRYPNKPTRATLAGKSHHKATAMAQRHPTAAALASYRRLRLPFARPQTLQTLQSPLSFAGKRYPNKPNTRHSRTQKPPQGNSNG